MPAGAGVAPDVVALGDGVPDVPGPLADGVPLAPADPLVTGVAVGPAVGVGPVGVGVAEAAGAEVDADGAGEDADADCEEADAEDEEPDAEGAAEVAAAVTVVESGSLMQMMIKMQIWPDAA